ncbi:MAG: NADH-quinone oxidoreductase subunit J [Anaerolineae bacterium]|nr:NADH-quinone oxidoreductase subunit J [Anaerolineae bacterium]
MELTLFVIIGAVAVVSAAMMLFSENAVHSALFLILNFACIAFFFLMLHAPFLAMVQITVYAGAIMVLFLFVIMLLGVERLPPEKQPRFPWLIPATLALALVFLVAVSAAIIQGEVELTDQEVEAPYVRIINALDGQAIDLYLDGERIARAVTFRSSTGFEARQAGEIDAALYAAGADPSADDPLLEQVITLKDGQAVSLTAVGTPDDPRLVLAAEDVSAAEDWGEKDKLRVIAVNALPDQAAIDVLDVTNADDAKTVIEALPYGEASGVTWIDEGSYDIGVYPTDDHDTRLAILKDADYETSTAVLWVFAQQGSGTATTVIIDLETDVRPSFGSPTHVGQLLFSRYVLPFEMVSLVLLAAMVGAIIFTREALGPRPRMVRRLANPPAKLEQPGAGDTGK